MGTLEQSLAKTLTTVRNGIDALPAAPKRRKK
jgi:hypothetical protein